MCTALCEFLASSIKKEVSHSIGMTERYKYIQVTCTMYPDSDEYLWITLMLVLRGDRTRTVTSSPSTTQLSMQSLFSNFMAHKYYTINDNWLPIKTLLKNSTITLSYKNSLTKCNLRLDEILTISLVKKNWQNQCTTLHGSGFLVNRAGLASREVLTEN